jgi:pimeloyl-ACP methyl ester carboxylesterase
MLPAARVPASMSAPWLYAGRATPELRRAHAHTLSQVSPATLRARVAALLSVDRRLQLRRVDLPMLYLRAKQDRLVGEKCWHAIRAVRPQTELAEFDAPHFLLQTEPAACAARVEEFIQRVCR